MAKSLDLHLQVPNTSVDIIFIWYASIIAHTGQHIQTEKLLKVPQPECVDLGNKYDKTAAFLEIAVSC